MLCRAYLVLAKLGGVEDADAAVVHAPALVQRVVEMRLELSLGAEFEGGGGCSTVRAAIAQIPQAMALVPVSGQAMAPMTVSGRGGVV